MSTGRHRRGRRRCRRSWRRETGQVFDHTLQYVHLPHKQPHGLLCPLQASHDFLHRWRRRGVVGAAGGSVSAAAWGGVGGSAFSLRLSFIARRLAFSNSPDKRFPCGLSIILLNENGRKNTGYVLHRFVSYRSMAMGRDEVLIQPDICFPALAPLDGTTELPSVSQCPLADY